VGFLLLFLVAAFVPASAATVAPAAWASTPIATAQLDASIRATLTRDYDIEVSVKPHPGDAWSRLARRVTGDAANWEDLATHNQVDENLKSDRPIKVPFALLRPNLQRDIIRTLFPRDEMSADG